MRCFLCGTDQKHVVAFCDGNFMCQLDCIVACADIWLNVISGYDCVSPDEISVYISGLRRHLPSSVWVGITQSLRAWVEQRGRRRGNLALPAWLCELGQPSCLVRDAPLRSSDPAEIYTVSSPRSQAFGFRLNYFADFPGSPARDGRLWGFSTSIVPWANSLF